MTDIAPEITALYAYATEDAEIATLEIRHPLIVSDTGAPGQIRLASVFAPADVLEREPTFRARLEADAPMNPGEIVEFLRAPIQIDRPERSTTGAPQVQFRISNVDARIGEALIAIARSDAPVEMTIRVFTLASALGGEPEVLGGFELVDPEISTMTVSVRAQGPDVTNIRFARQTYDGRFPLLGL